MKKLYKSKNNKVIYGICAGIANYFAIDPIIVRIVVIIGFFINFLAVALSYFIINFIIPDETNIIEQ